MKRNVMSAKVQQSTFVAAKSTGKSAKWRDYFQMTKPTISLLVVATVVPSMFMAADSLPSIAKLVWTSLGHVSWHLAQLVCSITL
jgi:heme O synthase-like polyprenyltransferase